MRNETEDRVIYVDPRTGRQWTIAECDRALQRVMTGDQFRGMSADERPPYMAMYALAVYRNKIKRGE